MSGDRRLGEGAAEFAPTAPHATPAGKANRAAHKRAKVGRIWRPLRVVTALALVLSLGLHVGVAVRALGSSADMEFKDNDDELTIPVDMFEEGQPPPPPEAPPVANTSGGVGDGPGFDAGVKPVHDAGAPALQDAGADAAPKPPVKDAGSAVPLGTDLDAGGAGDAGAGDAGVGSGSGPRDPASIVGMPGLVSSGPVNVTLLVNMAAIRNHPIGRRLGPFISAIPQWESFIHGNETLVDPMRDTDWVMVYGPSLIRTEKDAVLVHYSASDAVVDGAIDLMSKQYDKGGPFDTGVPGVKASLGHADNAERVFLRASSKLLAVVPPDRAKEFAKLLKSKGAKPRINPNEAMRLIVHAPHRQISIKGLKFPTELEELRIWIVPNADGSADVFAEGTVTPDTSCPDVATFMSDVIKKSNTATIAGLFTISGLTGGLLDNVTIACDEGVPKAHVVATKRQLEKILAAAAMGTGVQPSP